MASTVFGNIRFGKGFEEFGEDPRYVLHFGDWRSGLVFLIGYWLPHENPDLPVRVGVTIYGNPQPAVRADVIKSFRDAAATAGGKWEVGISSWLTLRKTETLHTFMAGPDHVRATKDYLLGVLKQVEGFRTMYPNLNW